MSYMKAVCGRVKSDIESSLSVVDQFFNLFFVCNLGDKASGYEFVINCHNNPPDFRNLLNDIKKALILKRTSASASCYHLNSSAIHMEDLSGYFFQYGSYLCGITAACRRSLLICLKKMFGAKLLKVFSKSFPCASHPPAAFCMFHSDLLVSVIAVCQILRCSQL